jgi:threonine dehydrogenase-like Zn-dependent dehydrogenase
MNMSTTAQIASHAATDHCGRHHKTGDAVNYKAWIAKAPKQPMVLETVDPGPLGAEEVEVAVEHCGLCHSDVSVLNIKGADCELAEQAGSKEFFFGVIA